MALWQEFFELGAEVVSDAVVAGGFAVVFARESVVPVLVYDCAARTQLDTFTGKKPDSELRKIFKDNSKFRQNIFEKLLIRSKS